MEFAWTGVMSALVEGAEAPQAQANQTSTDILITTNICYFGHRH